jgi:hypothetical protein
VLTNAASSGDLVETISFFVSSVINAIPAVAGAVTDAYILSMAGSKLTGTQVIPKATLPTGSVLQVVSTTKTDTFSTTATSFTDVTGLSVSITPTSSTSKILIFCTIPCSHASFAVARFNLVRGSTNICQPSSIQTLSGSKTAYYQNADLGAAADLHFLDSPATTSSTTYKIQVCTNGGTMFVGQRNSGDMSMPSTITVMEIAA